MLWYAIGFLGISLAAVIYALQKNVEDGGGIDDGPDWDAKPKDSLSTTLRDRFARF